MSLYVAKIAMRIACRTQSTRAQETNVSASQPSNAAGARVTVARDVAVEARNAREVTSTSLRSVRANAKINEYAVVGASATCDASAVWPGYAERASMACVRRRPDARAEVQCANVRARTRVGVALWSKTSEAHNKPKAYATGGDYTPRRRLGGEVRVGGRRRGSVGAARRCMQVDARSSAWRANGGGKAANRRDRRGALAGNAWWRRMGTRKSRQVGDRRVAREITSTTRSLWWVGRPGQGACGQMARARAARRSATKRTWQ